MPRTRAGASTRTVLSSSRRHSAAPIARLTTDEAERAQSLLGGVDPREAEAPLIGDVNATDRRRLALEQRPDAQRLEDAPAAVGQRGGAIVEARLLGRAERMRLDQRDLEVELRQRQREPRADETAAADRDVAGRSTSAPVRSCGSHQLLDVRPAPWRARRSAPRCRRASPRRRPRCARRCSTSASRTPLRAGGNVDARLDRHAPCRARARATDRRSCSRRRRARPCRASGRCDA